MVVSNILKVQWKLHHTGQEQIFCEKSYREVPGLVILYLYFKLSSVY